MAGLGTRTLLLDCDLRNSELRPKYGIRRAGGAPLLGAAHYLAGKAGLEEVLCQTNVPNGFMIPVASAIANPTILLESPRFAGMMADCAARFDCILVDTPPLARVADALNIACHCDGSVLVVRSGSTCRRLAANSVQLLRRTGRPLLGVVLNRVDVGDTYYYRYYGGSGYGYGRGRSHNTPKKDGGT